MAISIFSDKTHHPETQEVVVTLGSANLLWERLIHFIAENYQMVGDMVYGGKNYGWNLWYRKSGKSLVSLYPQENALVAQVVLGREQVEKALQLSLGEKVGRILRETPQLHDGCWLFIQVTTDTDAEDVEKLLKVKKNPIKRKTPPRDR